VVAFSLYADQDALWIGYDDGWERWTPEQSWLSSEVANKLCRQGVTAWARVPSGVLMGGEQAVCLVTAPGDAPVPLPGLSRERMPGSGSAVTALVMHEGRLYVGYSGLGLVAYDPETSRILHHWTAENGLPGNNVSSILFDPQERLWVATQTGLTLFNTGTGEYQKLNELDGLTDSEFNEGAFLRLHDGTFVFGTIKGVVAIRPSRMLGRKEPPMVIATRITALASGQHLDISSHLELPERSSALAVAYSSLEFYHPEAIRYQYRLLGKDGDWIDLGNKSQLVFGNFDSGRYVLALRARRSGQTGWGPVTRMTMRVLAPWWRSAWAVTMYVLLTLLLVGGIGYYRWRLMRSRFAALEQLAASEEKLRLAMDASGQGHWQWHLYDDEILLDRTQQVFGVSMPSSLPLVVFWGMIHVRDRLRVVKAWKGFLFGHEEGFQVVCRLEIGDASAWVEMRGQAVTRDENGMATRVLGTYRNVTAEKEKDARLDLLARAFEDTSEGVVVLDEQRRIIEVNNAALQLSGVSRRQLIGRKVTSLRGSRQRPEDYDKIWEEIGRSGKWQGELWVRTILGEEKPLWVCLSTLEDPSREERHYVAVFSDMSERKAAEEELKFLANYDPLTQLPNRALLWDRLSHALDTARRESRPLALMFLDLDHFKQINDTYGHGAGDKVLIAIADRLRATLRDDDTIARIAGDEFVIILEHFPHLGAIPAVTDKIRKAMTKPVEVEGRQLNVTFSIGVALYPGDGQDATALMKSADIAMYNAKQAGRNQVQFFAPQMQERVRQRLEIESDLRKALKLGELEVWYQPQVYSTPSSSREVVQLSGFEALVRWRHPEKGLISPAEFIPVAEESDLINELGLWVFEQALAQYAAWKSDWGFDGVMSVNLSARQLKIPDLAGHFATILGQSGIGAGRVVLEVTETALMDNLAEAQHTLTALREAGFGVALDDFGSGYSSLNYLRQLPIDYIKIDASFVHNLLESAIDRAIVTAVLEIARVQGLRVLAEGIERMEQKDFLLASGCRYFQGFLFGRPAPPDALTLWLQQYQQEHQPPHGPASS
jgi:diguanylate cyclase (GGDEF)-like protein/PAS domain S-box-containing protein